MVAARAAGAASGRPATVRPEQAAAERRILRVAAWMMERSEPFTRQDLIDAFPRDYAGKADAVEKRFLRDKASVERLGVALRTVDGDRTLYLVDRTALHLAPVQLDDAEAAVVWMAGRAALRAAEAPLRAELESALRKLTVGARGLPSAPPGPGALAPPADPEDLAGRLELVAEAVQRRRRLHLVYRGAGGAETVRDVDTYGYGLRRGEWFFVGHCRLRDAVRLFYLRRVVSLADAPRPGDHPCAVRKDAKGGDYRVPADFSLDDWRSQQPWDYLAHPPLEATVRLRGPLARGARALLPGAAISVAADGSREAVLQVRNLDGLVRQALAWGPDAEIVTPPAARELARAILDGLAGRLDREAAP